MENNFNNILYLIGGVPRSGKGYVRAQLLERKKIAGLSTDRLRGMLQVALPASRIHEKNGTEANAPLMFPFVRAFIETILSSREDYVLEGIELLPSLVSTLLPNEKIRLVFLGYPTISVEEKLYHIRHYASKTDWTNSFDDTTMKRMIERWVARSKRIQSDCEKYHLSFFDTSQNFFPAIENSLEALITFN